MTTWLAILARLTTLSLVVGLFLAAAAMAEVDGKAVYDKSCAVCHGPDGRGNTPTGKVLKVMDLSTKHWASPEAVPEIAKVVHEGVPRMPAMESKLKPEEIEAVAHYTQQLVKAGNPQQ